MDYSDDLNKIVDKQKFLSLISDRLTTDSEAYIMIRTPKDGTHGSHSTYAMVSFGGMLASELLMLHFMAKQFIELEILGGVDDPESL